MKLVTEDLAISLCPAQKDCPLVTPFRRLPRFHAWICLLDGTLPVLGGHGVHARVGEPNPAVAAPPLVASSIA
jgi:hypothetical protein